VSKESSYEEVLEWLFNQLPMYQKVGASAYKKDLTNSLELDEYLDHPHKAYKTIHVAGTNGKGSTCHMLASVLQTAGYKVGLYTSPHLTDFRERIRINGEMISKQEVINFIANHKDYLVSHQLSFFEMTVGMAFQIFKDRDVDIAIIETGLGGRLDSTNIITPILSIITSIDKDHTDLLGKTLKKIATEKAGIIKPNIPILINQTRPSLRALFKKVATDKNSTLKFSKNKTLIPNAKERIDVRLQNESIVRYAFEILNNDSSIVVDGKSIDSGIENVIANTGLQGRYQTIGLKPKIIADVAHNPAGLKALINKINQESFSKLHIVFGAVKGKALERVVALLPNNAEYYLCEPDSPRKLSIEDLVHSFNEYGLKNTAYKSPDEALQTARIKANEEDLILITGSTFIVAEIL
jgi:dihydrofolate synthase/folylpolyglutamate synthase